MTTIDFYTRVDDPVGVVAKLAAKALAQHGSVRILTPDAATTEALDRRLWLEPATGFLPHCRLASPLAAETPILIDHTLEHEGPTAVLVNMQHAPPPFFSRFERLAEIVGSGEDDAAAGRSRWRFYRERGYELRAHDLAGR